MEYQLKRLMAVIPGKSKTIIDDNPMCKICGERHYPHNLENCIDNLLFRISALEDRILDLERRTPSDDYV